MRFSQWRSYAMGTKGLEWGRSSGEAVKPEKEERLAREDEAVATNNW